MDKILYLEKRGCNFSDGLDGGESIKAVSDVGNYRVCTPDECIIGKDGNKYFLEFSSWDKYHYRTENKRTGKPLKKPIRELIMANAVHTDTEYTASDKLSDKFCYRNSKLEKQINSINRLYTLENILQIVNEISKDNYIKIEFI